MKNVKMRSTLSDKFFYTFNFLFLLLAFVGVIYPLIFILSASFSEPTAVSSGKVWLFPVKFNLRGYEAVFNDSKIWRGYYNSIVNTFFGTLINIALTILAAYPLSKKSFRSKKYFMFLFIFTMIFNGGLIPTYLLVNQLNLINTRWALWLPNAMSVYNMIITCTFFKHTIGEELFEAAQMDGCGDIYFLMKIVLPLSHAIIAVNALLYSVGHWNMFFDAMIYIQDVTLRPLQIVIRGILLQSQFDASMTSNVNVEALAAQEGLAELLKYSLIIVASIPMLLIYPFVQKHFVKGVMVGAIKG
ncbi:MAG: carbohydrate ABC transporter permease [Spirochaetales bacterium]|nr:carbohydrate ABC transporter permease [Spirochaetales bacterium]